MPSITRDDLRRTFDEGVTLMRRETPKIGGSVGGFVALVVCLVVVIIAACCAVVYLLRSRPSSEDPGIRRYRANSSSTFVYKPASSPSEPMPRFSKLRALLPWSSTPPHPAESSKSATGRKGWVRAQSGDGWAFGSDTSVETRQHCKKDLAQVSVQPASLSYSPAPQHESVVTPPPMSRLNSSSSVRFDLSSSPPYLELPLSSPQLSISTLSVQPDVSFTMPSPLPPVARSISPDILPAVDELSSTSPPSSEDDHPDRRKFSTHSGMSMLTLEGGTKFIESL
ncbi:hypothetical protein HGRIS_013734 [Hohenbuehelia grisea]|uniref:Transmembrane protein n=1 Tax=Hohenbuehelia grisea TaxID=104357 RepID=A0ABR3IWH0_9AGAR